MRRIATTVLAASLASFALMGCDQAPTKMGSSVAVVDIQRVAERSGRMDSMRAQLGQMQEQLRAVIQSKVAPLEEELKKADAEAKANPTKENEEKLQQARMRINQEANQIANALGAEQKMMQMQAKLLGDLRAEVAPVAMTVALERGMTVVMLNSESLLNYTKECDITDAVVAELQKAPAGGSLGGFGGGGGFGGAPGGPGGPGGMAGPGGPGGPGGPAGPAGPGGAAPSIEMPGAAAPKAPAPAPESKAPAAPETPK